MEQTSRTASRLSPLLFSACHSINWQTCCRSYPEEASSLLAFQIERDTPRYSMGGSWIGQVRCWVMTAILSAFHVHTCSHAKEHQEAQNDVAVLVIWLEDYNDVVSIQGRVTLTSSPLASASKPCCSGAVTRRCGTSIPTTKIMGSKA